MLLKVKKNNAITNHRIIFDNPPNRIPSQSTVDSPLLGNGDIATTLSYKEASFLLWLNKNDFWKLNHIFIPYYIWIIFT